ncbi:MAG: glyceraldehyde-3-phosphate dehydrogenase [Dokdonia sp.]|nr:glyceraldehyde-3-phosphate dehydrogenase [Dokdonia sp.]
MAKHDTYEKELAFQADRRRATVAFIKIVSDLWYDNSIELVLFRNQLIDRNVSEILDLHEYAGAFVQKPISIFDSVEIAEAIKQLDMPPAKLDIGKLTFEYHMEPGDVNATVLEKRASLLKSDSVHGDFSGTVSVDLENESLIINGTTVRIISANAPEDIDYTKYDIDHALVIDNTGAFRDKEALSRHLLSKGVEKVLLTAPGKGIPNIVHGVNHLENDPDSIDIFSAASCTTNAITPILKAIDDSLGVQTGHLETIHAYTNDQNLVDNMHSKYRRGRAAALNMVITETGAGAAVSKALPSFEGKLTSNAIRVPVPNGSLAILSLDLEKPTSVDGLNTIMKKYALEGDLVEQIKYSIDNELVSSDIVGSSAPSIYDSNATIVRSDGKNIVIYIWYDNEYGYSHQVIRLAKYIAKVRRFTYY